ncbi:MAG: hypothetical protein ACI37Q_03730 [Candidatus Gastranaerophilaceae bacterium]
MFLSVNRVCISPANSVPFKSNDVNSQGKKRFDDDCSSNEGIKTSTKLMLGATTLAGVAALCIAGAKGHLGQRIQKLLGKAEKNFENATPKTNEAAPKAEVAVKNPEKVVEAAKPNDVRKRIAQILKDAGNVDDKLVDLFLSIVEEVVLTGSR